MKISRRNFLAVAGAAAAALTACGGSSASSTSTASSAAASSAAASGAADGAEKIAKVALACDTGTVSYTHLDVYKRQVQRRLHRAGRHLGRKRELSNPFP